ncbi:YhaN family protein [Planctomycetes bacterium K23_9]|uniref:YhaN AAA domain-containing protein n=1 Tax=Stieleria marina TaxID=1930275 RepID=A0A517NYW0_9BACT|nr:hypothetical protein K239x_43150 [Planctomycetes bacterium K23_9]
MIIQRLDLKAFGGFTDFSIDLSGGPNRFHIVYGPNESGKSTSLRAINSFLFGFPRSTDDNYLHPNTKLRVGGVLEDEQGQTLECVRKKGTKGTLRAADDKTVVDESVLSELLGGVDRETFEHRFGLSHDELVRGGSQIIQGGGDLGSILFAAGAGVDRLREIQSELGNLCSTLFVPGGTKGAINQTVKVFREQKKELSGTQVSPAEYEQRKDDLQVKVDEIEEIQAELKSVATELASLTRLRDAMPLIPKWKSIQESLRQVGEAPLLDGDFIERRRSTQERLENATRQQHELSERRQKLQNELAELPDDSAVIVYQSQIESLFQKLGAREEASEQRTDLEKTCQRLERHIREKLRDLNAELPPTDDQADAIDQAVEKLRLSEAIQARVDELALKHDALVTQRNDAEASVDALSRRIESLQVELAANDDGADPESLSELLESVGKPDVLIDRLSQQQADADRSKRTCQAIHQRLTGIELSFEQAAKLRLPSESAIEATAARMRSSEEAVAAAKTRQDELTRERDQVDRRIKTQQASQPLPTLAELQQVRLDRDELVSKLSAAVGDEDVSLAQVETLRTAISHADKIVDEIHAHHEQVHQRSLDLAERDELSEEISQNELTIESTVELSEAAEQEWYAVWQSIGVAADTPKRMLRWVADHAQLVENVGQWNEEANRLSEIQRRVDTCCRRLSAALGVKQLAGAKPVDQPSDGPTLFDDIPEPVVDSTSFAELYQKACSLRRKLSDARQQRLDLQKRLLEAKQKMPDAQSNLQAKEKLVAAWQKDWKTITESFTQADDTAPTIVVELVRDINSLTAQKKERDIVAKRIASILRNEQEFSEMVRKLATNINQGSATDSADRNPHETIRELFQRLQAERSAAARRDSLRQQIDDVNAKLDRASEIHRECGTALTQLCIEAACESPGDLIEIERRSTSRREYLRQSTETEDKLRLLAAGESIDDLIRRADDQDEGVLSVEIKSKSRLLEELNARLSDSEGQRGVLRDRFNQIDAGNSAADLSQSLQMLSGQLQRDANEYARLKIAALILKRSIEHYRAANQGPVLGYAQEIFRELTCNEYRELRVEYVGKDETTLVGVKSSDETNLVPAALMSTGTADALYLSLRLASLRHQLSHGTKIPLIVDDCLVQMDDQRTIAALNVFAKLSLDTQVILFTHHQHLLELAASNLKQSEFHSHSLSS